MSRREYPTADLYEERERDFYRNGRRGTREYAEFDEEIRTTRTPDFLREGYGRPSNAGQLVVRGPRGDDRTEIDVETRSYAKSARSSPPRRREVEKEEIVIRDDRAPPRRRNHSVSREEFSIRRSEPDLRSRPRAVEKDDIDIDIKHSDARSTRSARPREIERDEIDIDIRRREEDARSVRSRRPRDVEETDIDIDIRRNSDARSVRPSRPREFERDEVTIRRAETERPPPRPRVGGSEEEIIIRRGEGPRPPPPRPMPRDIGKTDIDIDIRESDRRGPRGRNFESDEIDIDIKHQHGGRGRSPSRERERITIREQSRGPPPRARSIPPPNLLRRDTEEFVIRRRRPPSPSPSPSPPPMRQARQEIIIRRTEQRSPSPSPSPPPPPEPELPPPPVLAPIIRPPIHQEIHQEIITHHRHIDHGIERARSPSPLPLPPPPPPAPVEERNETLEIDIRRESNARGRTHEDEIEIRHTHGGGRERSPSIVSRARSVDASLSRRHHYDDNLEDEAQYYNRKALERGYPGEAYNGATRDWALVDVPPGTERVRLDGAGGGAQEITWQRYNGTRRSKFMTGGREIDTGYGEPSPIDDHRVGPVKQTRSDMWTEVTKDLVIKEAIEHMGYSFEETEEFFYVMEYLKYEDVLQLVEVSDEIRRARRRRIREIEWERQGLDHRHRDDERVYEREVIIDKRERRY